MPFLRHGYMLVMFFNKLKEEWFIKMNIMFGWVICAYMITKGTVIVCVIYAFVITEFDVTVFVVIFVTVM